MESGEIKSRSPFSTDTDTFYCLEAPGSPQPQATGFLGFQAVKCISFCTGGTSYYISALPPPPSRQGKTFPAPPFKERKRVVPPPPLIWLKLQATA